MENLKCYILTLFQSTLLQEERHPRNRYCFCLYDFNPRSYKRSDGANTKAQAETLKFQSTLLQEERLSCVVEKPKALEISIHAPTRGATIPQMASKVAPLYFNPRSYKRSDVFCNAQVFCAMLFQSTLLQEERRMNLMQMIQCGDFNPRSYKRSDKNKRI